MMKKKQLAISRQHGAWVLMMTALACEPKSSDEQPPTAGNAPRAEAAPAVKTSPTVVEKAKAPTLPVQVAGAGPNLACDLLTADALHDVVGPTFLDGKAMPLRDISHGAHKCQWNSDPNKKGTASVAVVVHTQGWDAAKKRATQPSTAPIWKPIKGYGERAEFLFDPPNGLRKTNLARKILAQVGDKFVEIEVVKFTMKPATIETDVKNVAKIVVKTLADR
jgi:hypothetical protein